MTTSADKKEEFYMKDPFDVKAITLDIPEKYDQCTANDKERAEAEEEEFGSVLLFPTARKLVDYRRMLVEATEKEVDDWFMTREITLDEQLKVK